MKLCTTFALVAALCLCAVFPSFAATTNPVAGVVRCTATADTITNTNLPYGAKIVAVKVNPAIPGSYYRLRSGTVSGAIIYETFGSAGVHAAAINTTPADPVRFTLPGAGLYYQTDDVSTTASITIYTE